ncbi:MAG: HXXEE domain-containing protein [Oscillospiraceae bacterium]|nr:HXXEE domain-containing protein [Oscillospiraceae bacterium]
MKDLYLLLPILFIIHDMEEIIGFGWFFRNNKQLYERFPKVTAAYEDFSTAGFALAVYEEFIPFFGISLLAFFFPCKVLTALWLGIMAAFTAHLFVHIGQSICIGKYIPSLITSVICLPLGIVILIRAFGIIDVDRLTVILMLAAVIGMMANLRFAHSLMHRYSDVLRDR